MNLDKNLIEKIRNLDYTLLIENSNRVILSDNGYGVLCLCKNYRFTNDNVNVYDKLIGKGAALLILELNVKNIYAKVITQEAFNILSEVCYVECDKVVENILNRYRNDLCPVEKIARDSNNVDDMLEKLMQFYKIGDDNVSNR